MSNVVGSSRWGNSSDKASKAAAGWWSDISDTRKRVLTVNSGIDEITPDVFATIKRDLEDRKITSLTAVKILSTLSTIANKHDAIALAKYKELINAGTERPTETEAAAKGKKTSKLTGQAKKDAQKAMEGTLVELTQLAIKKKQGTDA